MNLAAPSRTLLRTALQLDGLASGGMGVLLSLTAGTLAGPLGLPEQLLRVAGLLLVPYAAAVAWTGTRRTVSRTAAAAIVAVNMLWVAGSGAVLVVLGASLTTLGFAFVIAQALVVLGLAEAQWIGLRRTSKVAATA